MVEGPGSRLNAENIRSRVQKGQKVKQITGSMTTSRDECHSKSFHAFSGCTYVGVETLGKELFMYFGPRALRVHFGMNGHVRINPVDLKDRSVAGPSLRIQLTNDIICFFDSTVEIRPAGECERRVQDMEALDVCSPTFSSPRAEEVLRSQSTRMLCDALLDQTVLPGVGNIIKNEALFDSGLHPAVKVCQLTDCQIRHLVKMTRDFTLLFYKCRKSGSSIHKYNRVYKRPHCGQCNGKITVCRLGENGRMTYFCCNCQSEDPGQVHVSQLPYQKSVTSWLCTDGKLSCDQSDSENQEWACELCTLVNQPGAKSCEACLSPCPTFPIEGEKQAFSSFGTHLMKYPCSAFTKPQEQLKVNRKAVFGTSTLIFTRFAEKCPTVTPGRANLNPSSNSDINIPNLSQRKVGPKGFPGSSWKRSSEEPAISSQMQKKMRIDHAVSSSIEPQSGGHTLTSFRAQVKGTRTEALSAPGSPCCIAHRRPCALRVVRKEGNNKGRRFYTCDLPQETRCDHFEWADLHFPTCNHGKRCLLRTVLKLGPNNGRTFYTCPFEKGEQCDFFQWADVGP